MENLRQGMSDMPTPASERGPMLSPEYNQAIIHHQDVVQELEGNAKNSEGALFKIFTFTNIFVSLILGIVCLTLYPHLVGYSE